ncbi:MAG: hypothetical protein OEW91_12525 [Acidimicrobiia bacterium]|nr:hypothetical protein [Acidimicrobiia bacterium]
MIPIALVTLAIADAGVAGFRAAAGRNPLIDKRRYYRSAIRAGCSMGVTVMGVLSVFLVGVIWLCGDPAITYSEFTAAGRVMLLVYVPFAVLTGTMLAVLPAGGVQLRGLLTVLVFGPITLLRPFVIVGGALAACLSVRSAPVWIGCGLAVLATLLTEPVLGRSHRARLM